MSTPSSLLVRREHQLVSLFFFFNDTATTEIYTLSLHDALPIFALHAVAGAQALEAVPLHDTGVALALAGARQDRKSTRLNSSHSQISYAVFCLTKKNSTHQVETASNGYQCK